MTRTAWPALPLDDWKPTYETLHLWMQIVGKITLALTPLSNHFWNGAFRVTARGIETPPLTSGSQTLSIAFDFLAHQPVFESFRGRFVGKCSPVHFFWGRASTWRCRASTVRVHPSAASPTR